MSLKEKITYKMAFNQRRNYSEQKINKINVIKSQTINAYNNCSSTFVVQFKHSPLIFNHIISISQYFLCIVTNTYY